MKHTKTRNLTRALLSLALLLTLLAALMPLPAHALANGIYLATATPHYRHPTTGKIEDSGGDSSEVLGQSMTESATHNQALVEVDPQGNTYITVRLKLMDNIQNPQFQVDGSSVSASLMQEDYSSNTADYRVKVNDENSIIRINMYVVPMGREVIFYVTVSNLQSGSGDFVTSVKVNPTNNTTPSESPSSNGGTTSPAATTTTSGSGDNGGTAATSAPAASASPSASADPSATPETTDAGEDAEDDETTGLQEFDAEGNEVTATEETEEAAAGAGGGATTAVLIILAVVVVAGCVWYFGFYKKKKG